MNVSLLGVAAILAIPAGLIYFNDFRQLRPWLGNLSRIVSHREFWQSPNQGRQKWRFADQHQARHSGLPWRSAKKISSGKNRCQLAKMGMNGNRRYPRVSIAADRHSGFGRRGAPFPPSREISMVLLSIDDVAAATGLSRSTLAKRRCDGSGPAYFKIGRQILYNRDDIDAWIASRRRLSTWSAANPQEAA